MASLSFRAKRRNPFLFQVGVRDHLLAAGDEIAEGLALQHTVRQEREVGDLVQDLIPGREGFDIGPVGLADLFAGLAGGVLLRVGGVGRGLGGELALRGDFRLLGGPDLRHQRILHVHGDVVALRHLAIEVHTAAEGAHLAVTAHELALGDEDRCGVGTEVVTVHEIVLAGGQDGLEQVLQVVALVLLHLQLHLVLLGDQVLHGVGIDTGETGVLELALQQVHIVGIQLAVHQQDVIALGLRSLDVGVLAFHVGGIQIHALLVLVGLVALDGRLVLVEGEELAVSVLQEGELHGAVAELLVGKHAVFDEELEVVPLGLQVGALVFEDVVQTVSDLLRDISGDLLHVRVALQVAAGDVQRDIRGVDDTVKQRHEVRDDVVHVVRHKHLVAVQGNLVPVDSDALLDLREIQDTGQIEGIVHVQMDVEQRLLVHRIQGAVEREVVLLLEVGRGLGPQGLDAVDDLVLVGIDILAVLPLLLLAEDDRDGHELAVLVQEALDAGFLCIFRRIVIQIQGDDGAAVGLLDFLHLIGRGTVAAPFHGLRALLPGERLDGDLLRHHERAVEAEAEMADDAADLVLVLLQELAGGGERDLVDILVDLLLGHADTGVDDFQGLLLLVQFDPDLEVAQFILAVAGGGQGLELLGRIDSVGHQLPEEDLVVGIQELLDDGENVLGGYTDLSFVCHIYFLLHAKKPTPCEVGLA